VCRRLPLRRRRTFPFLRIPFLSSFQVEDQQELQEVLVPLANCLLIWILRRGNRVAQVLMSRLIAIVQLISDMM